MGATPSATRLEKLLALSAAEPDDAFCLYAIAQEHLRLGSPEEALRFFGRAIDADPTHAYAHFHRGRTLADLGRLAEARSQLAEGLAAANATGDGKAAGEIAALLESLPDAAGG
jgi:predicted Zn-dependent protease